MHWFCRCFISVSPAFALVARLPNFALSPSCKLERLMLHRLCEGGGIIGWVDERWVGALAGNPFQNYQND